MKLGNMIVLACEDLILLINKSLEFPKCNCKLASDMLVNKYAPFTASSLLKLKSEFHNSKLDLIEKDTGEWISNLEGLQIWMTEFGLKISISEDIDMNHFLNNLTDEPSGSDALTIEIIYKKMNTNKLRMEM